MGANTVYLHASATLLFFVFVWIVLRLERKELANVPLLKKVYRFL